MVLIVVLKFSPFLHVLLRGVLEEQPKRVFLGQHLVWNQEPPGQPLCVPAPGDTVKVRANLIALSNGTATGALLSEDGLPRLS